MLDIKVRIFFSNGVLGTDFGQNDPYAYFYALQITQK